jgi:hypothetical protein
MENSWKYHKQGEFWMAVVVRTSKSGIPIGDAINE